MLVLLPPSEGKTPPRRGRPLDLATLAAPGLTEPRRQVLEALVGLCDERPALAATVLGLSRTQSDLVERNARLPGAPTARADAVYTGVLYDALGLGTVSTAARRRATARLAVTSALFGLVRPGDRIPAYRLSGDATLPGVGAVAAHWRAHLDPVVREATGRGLVVDLRSGMYAGFWRPGPDLVPRVATVRVLHEVDGRRQVVSHFNKATKGRLVRRLLEDGAAPRTPSELGEVVAHLFADEGWLVEPGEPSRSGTRLDVVVPAL